MLGLQVCSTDLVCHGFISLGVVLCNERVAGILSSASWFVSGLSLLLLPTTGSIQSNGGKLISYPFGKS